MMIIINGASRGIGKFLLEKYLEKNEDVVGTFNSTIPIQNCEKYLQVNVRNCNEVETFFENIKDKLTNLTLLNCAGINYNSFGHKANLNKWFEVIEINLLASFTFIRYVLPIMREQKYGRIINFSSVVAQKGVAGTSAYSASKAALWGMTRSLALENASHGITINNLNLGYYDIGMIQDVPLEMKNKILNEIPVQRLGDPLEIFNSCEYIRNNPYLTGTSININGGLYA